MARCEPRERGRRGLSKSSEPVSERGVDVHDGVREAARREATGAPVALRVELHQAQGS
jgi:hypothetical protein